MTLSTAVLIHEPVNPEALFGIARERIGIPPGQPFTVEPDSIYYRNATHIASVPGGFRSALDVRVVPSGQPEPLRLWRGADEDIESEPEFARPTWARLTLDTAYALRPCCTCLHYALVREILSACSVSQFQWHDEYTGEWHIDLPPERCGAHA